VTLVITTLTVIERSQAQVDQAYEMSMHAARELGVSLSTVRRWSDLGYLRSYRTPGGQRRFSREQIESFLASLERTNGPAQNH